MFSIVLELFRNGSKRKQKPEIVFCIMYRFHNSWFVSLVIFIICIFLYSKTICIFKNERRDFLRGKYCGKQRSRFYVHAAMILWSSPAARRLRCDTSEQEKWAPLTSVGEVVLLHEELTCASLNISSALRNIKIYKDI